MLGSTRADFDRIAWRLTGPALSMALQFSVLNVFKENLEVQKHIFHFLVVYSLISSLEYPLFMRSRRGESFSLSLLNVSMILVVYVILNLYQRGFDLTDVLTYVIFSSLVVLSSWIYFLELDHVKSRRRLGIFIGILKPLILWFLILGFLQNKMLTFGTTVLVAYIVVRKQKLNLTSNISDFKYQVLALVSVLFFLQDRYYIEEHTLNPYVLNIIIMFLAILMLTGNILAQALLSVSYAMLRLILLVLVLILLALTYYGYLYNLDFSMIVLLLTYIVFAYTNRLILNLQVHNVNGVLVLFGLMAGLKWILSRYVPFINVILILIVLLIYFRKYNTLRYD